MLKYYENQPYQHINNSTHLKLWQYRNYIEQ